MDDRNRSTLHLERLGTTDEKGNRIYIHPEDVKGKWVTRRKIVYLFLVFFYMVLPWIYWNGKQIIKLDIINRKFYIFGETFFSHDGPLIFFLFLLFIMLLGFVTSILGRAWCGWTCPQTVYIDLIYRPIERLIEGKARQRKKLEDQSWNLNKISKKILKWSLFFIVSMHISHTLLGYFVGTHELFHITTRNPALNPSLFTTMLFFTALFLFDFGWFREQFCIIACPYGRIQSVMMDQNSLVVGYDYKRGEPRRNVGKIDHDNEGDCIDCQHCVKVCPTGIDIRRGTQMECIACTNCIDACDEIMDKLKRKPGLIRYTSESELETGEMKKSKRPYLYLLFFIIVLSVFVVTLNKRENLTAQFIRVGETPYKLIDHEKIVLNRFKVSLYHNSDKQLNLSIESDRPNKVQIVQRKNPWPISPGKKQKIDIFVKIPREIFVNGSYRAVLKIKEDNQELFKKEVRFVGPFK